MTAFDEAKHNRECTGRFAPKIGSEQQGSLMDNTRPVSVENPDGAESWFRSGSPHRDDGGPAFSFPDGTKMWCVNGECHREDGPAVIRADGTQEWWQYNSKHRENGPAVINPDGTVEYWVDGYMLTEEKFRWRFTTDKARSGISGQVAP